MESKSKSAEIDHGKWLLEHDPIIQWGWGTTAGQLRASRRAQLISNTAHLTSTSYAMEIGCGVGMFTSMFALSGSRILAVDISPELLERARSTNNFKEIVTFFQSPFEECDLLGPFDAIIGSSVLHHLDCGIAFQRIFQMLKPGGYMSFAEPNMLNPHVWFILKFRRFFPYVSPDETAFLRWPLASKLKSCGFEDVTITPFDWLHPSLPRSLIKSIKKVEGVFEKTIGIKEIAGSLLINARKPPTRLDPIAL